MNSPDANVDVDANMVSVDDEKIETQEYFFDLLFQVSFFIGKLFSELD